MNTRLRLLTVVLTVALAVGCPPCGPETDEYRQAMRDFVQDISAYAKTAAPGFAVIPQNGEELLTQGDGPNTPPAAAYLAAIDGQGREDLNYGYVQDNTATPPEDRDYMRRHLDVALAHGVAALVTDYCWTPSKVDAALAANAARGYLAFAAPSRELDVVPDYPPAPSGENGDGVDSLVEAANFLYVLNPDAFGSRAAYLAAIDATNYDVFIIDAFHDGQILTAGEVASLQSKPGGARRLVVAYMSIGEAEDYRYYWQAGWRPGNPGWIEAENPDWPGNYKVRYWDPAWQAIIFGGPGAYLDRILDAGFDGVYLDIIDAYEYFE